MKNRKKSVALLCALMLSYASLPIFAMTATKDIPISQPILTQHVIAAKPAAKKAVVPLTKANVEKFTKEFFANSNIHKWAAGAVVTVVNGGEVLLNGGYGYSDKETKQKVDPNETLFYVGSVSKVFTATAVLQLVEQGKIDLHADITKYVGDMTLKNETGSPVTVKDLLTHTSGVEHADTGFSIDAELDSNKYFSMKDELRNNTFRIINKPGTVYTYDNFASQLQGYIVEQVTGQKFEDYAQEHLFDVLDMDNSSFVLEKEKADQLAGSYDWKGKKLKPAVFKPTVMPEGSLSSTGKDMANYMLAVLNGGIFKGKRFLSNDSLMKMLTPQVSIHPDVPNMTYGFEFYTHHEFNGHDFVVKGGYIPGFVSKIAFLPDKKVGVFISSNQVNNLHGLYMSAFMDHFYPDERPAPNYLQPSQQQLLKFEGRYRNLRLGYDITEIKANSDGSLTVNDGMGSTIYRQVDPLFFLSEDGFPLAFKEENGKVKYIYTLLSSLTWAGKLEAPVVYADIAGEHPYRKYVDGLSPLIAFGEEGSAVMEPTKEMTRAEFAHLLIELFDLGYHHHDKPAFKDVEGHKYAAAINEAALSKLIDTARIKNGKFEPDRLIERQEAAVWIYNALKSLPTVPRPPVKLAGTTDEWALEAVQYVVAHGYYGPEVSKHQDGSIDFMSKKGLKRQEAAAILYQIVYPDYSKLK
ncbi:serine hydrolase domain-containing protein [Paenibacillus arenosi]|uniref:Beta-lactamase family protein n=1 Tax=Paenibacillus arenosi TaxID=2774142 RepID=A0ABR9AYL0_9BACL|nr:serine hydrolase domain-containing protein [Paenibacillus arenosi]MBD8499240.1 beta-lactamase family protein [Paenibacillus arenosi]